MNHSTVIYTFDGTIEGFFSVVFRAFKDRCHPFAIISRQKAQQMPIGEMVHVYTCKDEADRVAAGISERTTKRKARLVEQAFLVDEPETPLILWRYLYKLFSDTTGTFHYNMFDEDAAAVTQLAKRVKREVHRFHGLVRFRETSGRLFVAAIEPDHDILMMLAPHFRARMAGQHWVIYDLRRSFGVWYDNSTLHRVEAPAGLDSLLSGPQAAADDFFPQLWKHYYNAINIKERKNHRQMRSCMPQRYWKHLPEKKGDDK